MAVKVRNRPEQKLARMIQKSEGIKYTEALRRVRAWREAKNKEWADGEATDTSSVERDRQSVGRSSTDGAESGRERESGTGESAGIERLGLREEYSLAAPSGDGS